MPERLAQLRRVHLLAVLVLVLTATATRGTCQEQLASTKPELAGMSSQKLALVKPKLRQLVDEKKVPGAIVIVARHGKIVLFESVGWSNIDDKQPMQKDSILRFYSMTKPITSTAIMMLVEQQKIGLDDPVSKYEPQLAGLKVFAGKNGDDVELDDAKREMTIRDLLRHTSGLTYGFFGDSSVDQQYRDVGVLDGTLQDMVAKLQKLPLLYQPGTRFNYSVSSDLLGHIVERVSGQGLGEYFQEQIFKPLGMRDTAFHVAKEDADRLANNYGPNPVGEGLRVIDASSDSRYLQAPTFYSGGGGLTSTAADYMRFCQMLLNQGELNGIRLLKASTVEQMSRNQLPDEAYPLSLNGRRDGVGFGLGFSVVVEDTDYTRMMHVGEYGWGGAASTHFWISPNDHLAAVVLTQHMPFSFLLEETVKPLVYDAIVK